MNKEITVELVTSVKAQETNNPYFLVKTTDNVWYFCNDLSLHEVFKKGQKYLVETKQSKKPGGSDTIVHLALPPKTEDKPPVAHSSAPQTSPSDFVKKEVNKDLSISRQSARRDAVSLVSAKIIEPNELFVMAQAMVEWDNGELTVGKEKVAELLLKLKGKGGKV